MKRDLILVIDMQNVYAKDGAWCCPKAETASQNIHRLLDESQENSDVIFTKFLAPNNPQGTWEDYNRENVSVNEDVFSNELMESFSEDVKKFPVYLKSTYSSYEIPEVKEKAKKASRVVLCGVVAECCVLSTAFALIDAGVDVVYLTDAVAGIDEETEKATVKVLEGLSPIQVKIMTTKKYLTSMGKGEK